MNRDWPWEALAFGESVQVMLERLGAVDLARRAEHDRQLRSATLARQLERLGVAELDPYEDSGDAIVAARAAKIAGGVVAPWPIYAQLVVPPGARTELDGLYLTVDGLTRLEHLDLFTSAAALDLRTGRVTRIVPTSEIVPMRLDPFGVGCTAGADVTALASPADWRRAADLSLILSAFYVLGGFERALTLAAEYAVQREQFGQPIANFGAVQWRLSDVAVSHYGLAELAKYTLWQFCEGTASPADTLALRVAMLEAGQVVLANAHQVFGAVGLTEAHDLAVIDRHLQPLLRRPAGYSATSALLRDAIRSHGFDGLYPIGSVAQLAPMNGLKSGVDASNAA